ncbi:hypothetical protein Tco_0545477 [Tanacetum coccineum]
MKKFPEIPKRIEEDYHSIKDDIPLVSVYTAGDVRVRGMPILDAFITTKIHATVNIKEYETVFMKVDVLMNQSRPVVSTQGTHRSTPRAHRTPTLTASPQGKKRKQSGERDHDHDNSEDSLEPESHKDNPEHVDDDDDTDDKNVDEEEGAKHFWKTHKQVNQVLHQGVSQLAEKATEDLIKSNLKPCIAATIIKDHDAFCLEVPDLVSQEFNAQAPKIIEELFMNYVQSNVIQVHPTTTTSTETTSLAYLQQQLYFRMKRSL